MPGFLRLAEKPARIGASRQDPKSWIKKALTAILGGYEVWRIYRCDLAGQRAGDLSDFRARGYEFREVDGEEIAAATDPEIRARAFYAGDGFAGFAVSCEGEIVCLQCFWYGERYRLRNFWPLRPRQAKSVELFTTPAHRGKGLATALKTYSAEQMKEKGFDTLFSRIWHSHKASCRVSEKAGWTHIATVLEFTPFGLRRTIRLTKGRSADGPRYRAGRRPDRDLPAAQH